jgi:hypothetical protein
MNSFAEYLRGVVLGVVLGISGTRAYQATFTTFSEVMYKESKVAQIVEDTNTLSCVQGVVETVQVFMGEKTKGPDCDAIAKRWADIYREKKK